MWDHKRKCRPCLACQRQSKSGEICRAELRKPQTFHQESDGGWPVEVTVVCGQAICCWRKYDEGAAIHYLHNKVTKLEFGQDLNNDLETFSIRDHGVILSSYVEILWKHTHIYNAQQKSMRVSNSKNIKTGLLNERLHVAQLTHW